MTELWLISVPGEQTVQASWEKLNHETCKKQGLSLNYKFEIPDLKVGTLDTLVGMSDDLVKLDTYVEQVAKKLAHSISDVIENKGSVMEQLQANGSDLVNYLCRFQWDSSKYPTKHSLKQLHDHIHKQVSMVENDLKSRHQQYNTLKTAIQSMERKQTGSLVVRNLSDLVRKEHFVLGSEYLTTLMVVVGKINMNDWKLRYEKLSPMIVPRSSELICEDTDNALFSVTVFTKVIDEFKQTARENKFIVRDFSYNEEEIEAGRTEMDKLEENRKKSYPILMRWLKVNFSECFIAWTHVKALRVFVESVLRYGLPVNFIAVMMQPTKKNHKRLRDTLNQLYSHLDTSINLGSGGEPMDDIPGLNFGQNEYYPYVYFKMSLDMMSTQSSSS